MGLLFSAIAALLASISNLFLRRSIDAGGSSRGYLVVQLTFSFVMMILLNPIRTQDYGWNGMSVSLGLLGGVFLGLLMWSLGKALETGPAGLSIAILNTASVMPAVVLTLLFGSLFGHSYNVFVGAGSVLVLGGIFWASWTREKGGNQRLWGIFVFTLFLVHTLFLLYLQWWAMVLNHDLPLVKLLPMHIEPINIQWFMPALFLMAALVQWLFYLMHPGTKKLQKAEISYGIWGGVANGACNFFLILAPQVATHWQNGILFPVFSVGIILICNLWAQLLYKEKVNWKANALCVLGLVIGSSVFS